ncbi:GMC family oxidoreductase [Aspergillus mulundensis]|uniref:Choline dehydrogenase n=1 Tax=Aspergillus mulundensis TaxID=1810919 RepID=A0A3D8T5A1_9EURO|nr:Choline dehydrogenase [Aspergillus mulundensis]RDW93709.1 Choline dehydrogenase [Aspergillus mulundensis]
MHLHASLSPLALLLSSALAAPALRDNVFDYIVVGGGNAGLTIASRLSENATIRVAVIEAGTFYESATGNESIIPGNGGLYEGKAPNITNPAVEWGFMTTPQAGLNGQRVHYPRGKTLGGCTALNAMNYERPSAGSMDLWAELVSDSSYTWNNTFPYFQKSIDFKPPNMATRFANSTPAYDSASLASGGDLSLTHPNYAQPFSSWLANAMTEAGMEHIPGFQSGSLMGSGWLVHTIDQARGKRASSETAFLRPFLDRTNLVVFDHSMAEKVLFRGKVATGVLVSDTRRNTTFSLKARREVIVSAGTFQSPQLLMVSGVGPASLLAEYGIPVVVDQPGVGQNMHDHVLFGVSYKVNVETAYALRDPRAATEAARVYYEDQAGPLSNPGGDYAAFERLPPAFRSGLSPETEQALSFLPTDWPELQYGLFPAYAGNFYDPYIGGPNDGNYVTLLAILVSPQSRGNISISSSSIRDPPLINPAWLTHPADVEMAVAAFKRLRSIFATRALEGVLIGDEYYPGEDVSSEDDEGIVRHLRNAAYTMSHAAGTCKMGVEGDEMAVVDSAGRVFGTKNCESRPVLSLIVDCYKVILLEKMLTGAVRVVDASTFPFLPPNVPQSVVYMLAEKISDDIKSPW